METVPQDLQQGVAKTLLRRCLYHGRIHFKRTFAGDRNVNPASLTSSPAPPPPKIDLDTAGKNIFDNNIGLQQDPATPLAVLVTPAVLATLAAAPPSSIYLFTICPLTDNVIAIHENLWIAHPNDVTNNKERLLELLNNRPAVEGCKNVWIDPSPHP